MGLFTAWRYVARAELISPEGLLAEGVRCVLLDRDNTIVPRDTKTAPPEVLAWLDELRAAGIKTCIVSNNFHTKQVMASAAQLGCDAVDHAMKPAPFALWRALKKTGVGPHEAILVGDQVFTDVASANLAGVRCVLVRPQSKTDLWYTHIFRIFESLTLRGKHFEGE